MLDPEDIEEMLVGGLKTMDYLLKSTDMTPEAVDETVEALEALGRIMARIPGQSDADQEQN